MDLSNKNLSMKRAASYTHSPGYKFPVEKRIEVATKWLALGNMRLVAELTGVSYQLCRIWKMQPWWKDLIEEIKASRTMALDTKLSRLVDKSLDTIADRLENGDVVFNQKTGEVVRKEVSLKDATKVATDLLTRQAVIQKQEQDKVVQQDQVSVKEQLALLATEFAKFNRKNTGPVEDARVLTKTLMSPSGMDEAKVIGVSNAVYEEREEGLQEGSGTLYIEAGSEEEASAAECSSGGDDESWESEEGGWEGSGPQSPTL